jgi:hypothetical protein
MRSIRLQPKPLLSPDGILHSHPESLANTVLAELGVVADTLVLDFPESRRRGFDLSKLI